jgi:hypothetical protein
MPAHIRIYHNPHCERCARIGRFHRRFDLLNRIEISIEEPATGPLVPGEVVVEELATGRYHAGFPAYAAICRAIPLYCPVRLLFSIPVFRRHVAREISAGKITEA